MKFAIRRADTTNYAIYRKRYAHAMKSSAGCLKIRINTFSHLLTLHSKILSALVILSTEPLYPCRSALVAQGIGKPILTRSRFAILGI